MFKVIILLSILFLAGCASAGPTLQVEQLDNGIYSYKASYQKDKNKEPLTKELLDEIVDTNDKRRFEYSEDGWNIRARQGHSVDVDLGYIPKQAPDFLYHGTAERFIPAIRANGLNKRKRHHVHLSKDHGTAVKVGQRHGKPFVLKIDCQAMKKDGYDFFETDNNVWLVDDVPAKYIDFNWNTIKGAK